MIELILGILFGISIGGFLMKLILHKKFSQRKLYREMLYWKGKCIELEKNNK
jgi:hypothetical protein